MYAFNKISYINRLMITGVRRRVYTDTLPLTQINMKIILVYMAYTFIILPPASEQWRRFTAGEMLINKL